MVYWKSAAQPFKAGSARDRLLLPDLASSALLPFLERLGAPEQNINERYTFVSVKLNPQEYFCSSARRPSSYLSQILFLVLLAKDNDSR